MAAASASASARRRCFPRLGGHDAHVAVLAHFSSFLVCLSPKRLAWGMGAVLAPAPVRRRLSCHARTPSAPRVKGKRSELMGQVFAQRKVSRKFRADLDAHKPPRVHRGREEVGLARAGTVPRKRERSQDVAPWINGINIQMNIYSVNRLLEPRAARMRGTQGRNAHGRHGRCREPAARAGSLPCASERKSPAEAGLWGVD